MSGFNDFGNPGLIAKVESTEREPIWGPRERVIWGNGVIDSTLVDSRSTVTSNLQPGLLMGQQTTDKQYYIYNPDGTDGTEVAAAIIASPMSMLNAAGVAADKNAGVILGGCWKAAEIQGLDLQARKQLVGSGRVVFDDDIQGGPAFLGGFRSCKNVATSATVVAADNGALFVLHTATGTFTLPTLAIGLVFEFVNAFDAEFIVASAAGDDMVVGNDLSADSITYTTASQQIGARVRVESIYVDTTLKWLVSLPHTPFGTGTATLAYAIAT